MDLDPQALHVYCTFAEKYVQFAGSYKWLAYLILAKS